MYNYIQNYAEYPLASKWSAEEKELIKSPYYKVSTFPLAKRTHLVLAVHEQFVHLYSSKWTKG